MYKFILFVVFLSITDIANAETHDPPMQIFITDVQDTGTYTRPNLKVGYAAYPDSQEHAEQLVPYIQEYQYYGVIYIYKRYSYSDQIANCFGPINHGCTGVRLIDSKYENGRATFREANADFIEQFGTQGTINTLWRYRPYESSICIGVVQDYTNFNRYYALAFPNSCVSISPKPVSCEVSSDNTIELDHGILDAKSLQATHSKTASLTIDCAYYTSMKLEFTEPTITLAKGLISTLSLKVDGRDFSNGKTFLFQNDQQSRIDITSTLKAVGDIEPNTYSGSSVLIINIQ